MCFDYDGVAVIHESNEVKCRKPHKCLGCRRVIERGETALYTSSLYDGHWSNYYTCNLCQRMIYSIVVEELNKGCGWYEAWCNPYDLREYLSDRAEPVQLLGLRTLADCRRYVDDLWLRKAWFPIQRVFEQEFAA